MAIHFRKYGAERVSQPTYQVKEASCKTLARGGVCRRRLRLPPFSPRNERDAEFLAVVLWASGGPLSPPKHQRKAVKDR